MKNIPEIQESPVSAAISRWENEGGAIMRPNDPKVDSIKIGRPTIIAAFLLAAIVVWAINLIY
jgi:hypothetical protein